jgi:hypothetical protein
MGAALLGGAGTAAAADAGSGMSGALGDYPFTREASGTAWQPDASEHAGIHLARGEWMLMGHALLNVVDDWQQGARGADLGFVSGMLMGAAVRELGSDDTLRLRAMLSPDPVMGKSGFPLLLASGETADGVSPLVDRQHPHNLFMELSASDAHRLSAADSVFVYAGLPGEAAFGPPAFMHRLSTGDSPEAPITHHWLDSTHISNGVVTLGWVRDVWKLEASRFRGREPDQFRYKIETGALDSSAARLSWNPSAFWSLQASWAAVTSPEQLYPAEDLHKASASAIYTRPLGAEGWWSTTAAWGRRSSAHGALDAGALESAVRLRSSLTVFARFEREQNDELVLVAGYPGAVRPVAKASLGAIRDFAIAAHIKVGVGALYAVNFLPPALIPLYGSEPTGAMVFARLKID